MFYKAIAMNICTLVYNFLRFRQVLLPIYPVRDTFGPDNVADFNY